MNFPFCFKKKMLHTLYFKGVWLAPRLFSTDLWFLPNEVKFICSEMHISFFLFLFCFFFCLFVCLFLGPHLWHMEVPRRGVEPERQLQAYTTAMQDVRCICDLYHSSQQHHILNSLSKARDQTHTLMDMSQICYCWATMGNSQNAHILCVQFDEFG